MRRAKKSKTSTKEDGHTGTNQKLFESVTNMVKAFSFEKIPESSFIKRGYPGLVVVRGIAFSQTSLSCGLTDEAF
jgi:hypothetical protein